MAPFRNDGKPGRPVPSAGWVPGKGTSLARAGAAYDTSAANTHVARVREAAARRMRGGVTLQVPGLAARGGEGPPILGHS